jgi:cytochrome c oxidase subunit III
VLNVPLATLNTAILIASSITMVLAWAGFATNNAARGKQFLAATIALGTVFMIIKFYEYSDKFSHGIYPSTDNFYGIYFVMTGLHLIHIIGGLVVLAFHLVFGGKMWKNEPERFTNRIEVTGLYWHFVDMVWLILFPALYLT